MITIYKSGDAGLITLPDFAPGSWIKMIDPDPEEINRVQSGLNLPPDFIRYSLDIDERARSEKEDSTVLIILRVPHFVGEAVDVPYNTIPLGIILLDEYVVTVCKTDSGVLQELSNGKARGLRTGKRRRFVLHLLLATADRFLTYLREINRAVDALEDRLEVSLRNKEVLGLLRYQKSLTYFTTALTQNETLIRHLMRHDIFSQYPEDEELLDDTLVEIRQALEMTNISSGILSQMMDAFASIISNNLNVVMKFLASVTIILALPTLVASIYGMNLKLPLGDHPDAFWLVSGLTVTLVIVTATIFARRDWL